MSTRRLKLSTVHSYENPDDHITVQVAIDGEPRGVYCGDSWCTGGCGHPALRLVVTDAHGQNRDLKLHSSIVAMGSTFQQFRVGWTGSIHDLPEDLHEEARKLWWL